MRMVTTIEAVGLDFQSTNIQILPAIPDEASVVALEKALAETLFDMVPAGNGGDEDLMVTLTCRSTGKGMAPRVNIEIMEGIGRARLNQIRRALANTLWDLESDEDGAVAAKAAKKK